MIEFDVLSLKAAFISINEASGFCMLGKTNQLDALLGQIGWALDNSSDNQDESTAEIEVDAIKNLDLEPNEHDQGGTQAITETNLMSAIDQQSSSKVTFSELVQERSISFVGSKPASPNANGHEDLHLELYHLDFKDADQISGSEKSDDDIYQLSNEMLEYQDPTAMDEDEQIQAGLGDVLTYDAPEPNQPEESEDDLFITQEPDSQLAKNLAVLESMVSCNI